MIERRAPYRMPPPYPSTQTCTFSQRTSAAAVLFASHRAQLDRPWQKHFCEHRRCCPVRCDRVDTALSLRHRFPIVVSPVRFHVAAIGTLVLALFTSVVACAPTACLADEPTMEVSTDQRVSLSGRAASLKSVVEEVCFRAGVDLRFYDASDRPFGGTYQDLPLATLLERLLRTESYLAEVIVTGQSGAVRVVALRVLGDPSVASARRARGGGAFARLRVPPALVAAAFGDNAASKQERDAALSAMAAQVTGSPSQLAGFLATDAEQIALAVRRHKGVEEGLRQLQRRASDPRIAKKLDDVLAALATLSLRPPSR